jgi:Holliday junction resolvase RusA-like endonuclease
MAKKPPQLYTAPLLDMVYTLPWPISANNSKMPVKRGKFARLITTPNARKWKDEANRILNRQAVQWCEVLVNLPTKHQYEIRLDLYPPSLRGDLANAEKLTIDAIKDAGIIKGDSMKWLVDLRLSLASPDPENPRVLAWITVKGATL